MQANRTLGLMLAATVGLAALAGCNPAAGPTGAQAPTGNQAPAASVQKAQIAAEAQAAAQIQRDLADTDMMADGETGFVTMIVGQPAPEEGMVAITTVGGAGGGAKGKPAKKVELNAKVRAAAKNLKAEIKDRLKTQRNELRNKAANRLKDSLDAFKKGNQKTVTENEFGGKTFTFTFDMTLPNGASRIGSAERVFNADKVLVSSAQEQEWKGPNGRIRTMERTTELQEDGSTKVSGKASDTFNGQTRTYTFEKTISPDGKVSGTGTMTRGDKTVTITFGGSEAKETTTVTDPATNTTATAETSAETGTAGTVTVTEGGTTATVTVTAETATEPTASPSPTASAAASV
jgi:hypothetical protein